MEIDETVSHSPTVTTNNKRNSTEDGSNNTVGGSIPVSSNLIPGSRLEARDGQGSDKWFSVKVQEVDAEDSEVLVHYHNWNSRHDEWIPIDSPRLRVPQRTSSRHDSGSTSNPCDEGKEVGSIGGMGGETTIALGGKSPAMKEFKSGEKVMAVWKLNRKYPAKIVRFEPDGTYLVEFCEDGVECKVKPNNIRRLRKEEQELFETESNGNGIDSSLDENLPNIKDKVETARSSRRRDRKMKFDVKSVLNIRTTPPPTPPPSQLNIKKSSQPSKAKSDLKHNSKKGVDTVNKFPSGTGKTNLSTKNNSAAEANDNNKVTVKKDVESKVVPRKKQPNQYTKRNEELQKKENKAKELNSINAASDNGKVDIDTHKSNKNKKKAPKSSQPVTNGNNSTDKETSTKCPSNNNSSKSSLGTNSIKSKEYDQIKSETYSSKSVEIVQTVTGKRKRKPKKFWDEAEVTSPTTSPPLKIQKKKSPEGMKTEIKSIASDTSVGASKNKHRRSTEVISSVEQPNMKSKNLEVHLKAEDILEKNKVLKSSYSLNDNTKLSSSKALKKDEPTNKKCVQQETVCNANKTSVNEKFQKSENGKVLLYRTSFDMTDDPSKIAAKMKEGVNIPGPGVSIPVDSTRLPKGWEKRVIQRGIGVTKGKWDVFIVEEEGRKSFRSKTDLQRHIDERKLPYTSDAFDFSLDDNLKKLRQIWKQYIVKPRLKPGEKMSPLVPAKKGKKKNEGPPVLSPLASSQLSSLSNLQLPSHTPLPCNPISPFTGTTSPLSDEKDPRKANAADAICSDVITADELIQQNFIIQRQEREAELIATKLGVVSETGQGIRCSIPSCSKLFRKEKLLRQHVKHYHPKEYKEVINNSRIHYDHENDMLTEMKPPKSGLNYLNNDALIMDSKKRKLSQHQFELSNENNKRQKRYSVGFHSQHSADEDELEIDSPTQFTHMHTLVGNAARTRNDSMLSASSGLSDGEILNEKLNSHLLESHSTGTWNCGNMPNKKGRLIPPPSTPPTFRFSKRRQAQLRANRRNDIRTSPRDQSELVSSRMNRNFDESVLNNSMSPKVALTVLDDSMLASPALRLTDQQQVSPVSGYTQTSVASVAVNAPGQSSYPPSEMDVLSVTGSEHLTTEELVNCSCRRLEEDGLMIQCDICLCWQHGSCLAIEEEDQVPEYYVCETCRNPRLGRTSAKYSVDQDWLNKGILPSAIHAISQKGDSALKLNSNMQHLTDATNQPLIDKETAFRKLSELMADLANLSKLLHSLRVKLHIASQSNNSKVFMWSSIWDQPTISVVSQTKKEELPATNFSSQQLFNTGGMLTSVGESDVNLSQDDIAANLNFIQTTSSNSLQASLPLRPDTQLSETKLTSKLDPVSTEFSVSNGSSLHINHSENMKVESNENTDQFSPICEKINHSQNTSSNSSSNEHGNSRATIYPCLQENNTLLAEPQNQQLSIVESSEVKQPCAPTLMSEEKNILNGQFHEESSSVCTHSTNTPLQNSVEQSSKCLEIDYPSKNNDSRKESNGAQNDKNWEEAKFKIPPATGIQSNGLTSNHVPNDNRVKAQSQVVQHKLAAVNTASEALVNGNISDNCNSDENVVPAEPKKIIPPLSVSNEKMSKFTAPTINGENHLLSEKSPIFKTCNDLAKDISIAVDVKTDELSTNSQTKVVDHFSERSEPQINGLLDDKIVLHNYHKEVNNTAAITGFACSNRDDKLATQGDRKNGELSINETSLKENSAEIDKALGNNNFEETQHVLLDENQEVDLSMIPSLSEVQQLLPSLMSSLEEQLISDHQPPLGNPLDVTSPCINPLSSDVNHLGSIDVSNRPLQHFHTQLVHAPVIFPETKRLDKHECRLNLLHHIDALQTEFDYRLNLVEKTMAEIDSNKSGTETVSTSSDLDEDSDPAAKTKAILTLLLHDLRTSKNLVSLV